MLVNELIAILKSYPQNLPVAVEPEHLGYSADIVNVRHDTKGDVERVYIQFVDNI